MVNQRIAIVGAGANGAAFGADMVRAGLDVTFIDQWPDHVEAMKSTGIQVNMPEGTEITPVRALHMCEVATLQEYFDIIVICVKAYDTRWACELIKPLVSKDGLVVGLQNGMTMDDIASIMGAERTIGAVIEVAAFMSEPGVIGWQTGRSGTWVGVGAYDETTLGREKEIANIIGHAGTVEIRNDIRSAKWMKLIVNASEFLPSSILNLPLADAVKLPGIHDVMKAAGKEAVRTGLALGYNLVPIFGDKRVEENDPDHYASALLDAVLSKWTLPDTKVTTLQDWTKGRRAEVDDINGLVVREQENLGSAAPVNKRLVEIAHQIERGELNPDPSHADLLRSLID